MNDPDRVALASQVAGLPAEQSYEIRLLLADWYEFNGMVWAANLLRWTPYPGAAAYVAPSGPGRQGWWVEEWGDDVGPMRTILGVVDLI